MCYSAQVWADYRKYVRAFGADLDIAAFVRLYVDRAGGSKVKIPKGMDFAFEAAESDEQRRIRALISDHNASEIARLEHELFQQSRRLADADRSLAGKATKKAANEKRIATNKIEAAKRRLADLKRSEPRDRDGRIFPGVYAPVMVMEGGRRVIKPMRYQCRIAGKPALYDRKYPGTYNARRDNLEGFWRPLFGHSHGVIVASAFYENVSRHRLEGRELAAGEADENVILEFKPRSGEDMLVACLWSQWSDELVSFAAITDDPPAEVAAAGHDRCIVPIKPEHLDAWLAPRPQDLAQLYGILDDRARPYYEHRLAA